MLCEPRRLFQASLHGTSRSSMHAASEQPMGRKASQQNVVPPGGGGRHGCWCARRAFEGIGCAHAEHAKELPACDVAEASDAFSLTGEGSGGKAGDQARSASPGVAERAACVRR